MMSEKVAPRILVVEDEPATAELERRTLERAGIRTCLAKSIKQAKEFLSSTTFEAILLDYQLPDGEAWEIVDIARAKMPPIPVVLVTAMGSEKLVAEAIQRGVSDYVRKSGSCWDQLPDTVHRVSRLAAMEARLRHSDALLRSFCQHASDVIVTLDTAGAIVFMAPSFSKLTGIEPSTVVGHSFTSIVDPENQGLEVFQSYPSRMCGRAVFRCRTTGDGPVWVEANFQTIDGLEGQASGENILGILRDISEQRRASERLVESEARFRGAFETAAHGMALVSTSGHWLKVNAALCDIVGYTAEELLATNFQAITHADDLGADLHFVEELLSGRRSSFQMEKRYYRKDGETIWVLLSVSLVRDSRGCPIHFVSQIIDITQRRRSDEAMAAAVSRADRANRAKDMFLANMSHELRTPMNAIIGMADLMAVGVLPAAQREQLTHLKGAADCLLAIIDDVLDLSKIEAGKLVYAREVFDLTDVTDNVLAMMRPLAEAKAISLAARYAPGLPDWVTGDDVRLRQVLTNLLGNAVKFTEGGHIALDVRRRPDGQIVFEVSDTGIGIAEDKKHLLFENFTQVHRANVRRYGGTGLGLAICKRLVEGMGGTIDFESREGLGSTFRFYMPLPESAPKMCGSSHLAAPANLRVLVAEDMHLNKIVIEAMLGSEGHHVTIVQNGAEALQALETEDFDIVLMDVEMPVLDGLEATRAIRRLSGRNRDIPIIAVTANAFLEEALRCREAGMNGHLAKPLQRTKLIEQLSIAQAWRVAS